MKHKKADGNHFWMIIGLIIAILILFSYFLFIQKPASNIQNIKQCDNIGGNCRFDCRSNEIPNKLFVCNEPNLVCCTPI